MIAALKLILFGGTSSASGSTAGGGGSLPDTNTGASEFLIIF